MFDNNWYFGKPEAEEHGTHIQEALGGKIISKRVCDGELPGGLIYESFRLGLDLYVLLRAIEGMCWDGRAKEIDDSHYQIMEAC